MSLHSDSEQEKLKVFQELFIVVRYDRLRLQEQNSKICEYVTKMSAQIVEITQHEHPSFFSKNEPRIFDLRESDFNLLNAILRKITASRMKNRIAVTNVLNPDLLGRCLRVTIIATSPNGRTNSLAIIKKREHSAIADGIQAKSCNAIGNQQFLGPVFSPDSLTITLMWGGGCFVEDGFFCVKKREGSGVPMTKIQTSRKCHGINKGGRQQVCYVSVQQNLGMQTDITTVADKHGYFPPVDRDCSSVLSDAVVLCACSTVVWVKAYYAEEPRSKVTAPPPNDGPTSDDVKGLNSRLETFRRRNLQLRNFPEEEFARAGFYVPGNDLIICSGCQIHLNVHQVSLHPADPQCHYQNCHYSLSLRKSTSGIQQVQSDTPGRTSDDIADPPGQQSLYIRPGDIRKESYRLSTFENFPITCSKSRKNLANSGFYFTGFFDRVKCFACARTVERWEETDNPADQRWHKSNCPLLTGEDCGNVPLPTIIRIGSFISGAASSSSMPHSFGQIAQNPGQQVLEQRDPQTGALVRRVRYPSDLPERIRQTGGTFEIGPNNQVTIQSGPGPPPHNPGQVGVRSAPQQPRRQWRMANVISADHKRFLTNLFLNRELDRLSSFARWPVGTPNIAPAYLAKSGFFYLGDMDRTQCFSCGGVLRNWKLEDDANIEHRSHFPQCLMVLGTDERNISVHEHPETEQEKERNYPCRFPSNPHMRGENARLATFDQRWPVGRTAATPAEIAQAGFFFLGERDRAKCWYCNGGLQNWEYDDIPWIEHAKWFPNCQFLLRVKGQHFVYRHLALNPHLARPIIAKQDGSPLECVGQAANSQEQTPRFQDVPPPSGPVVNQPEPTPVIIDPQVEMRRHRERVEDLLKNSDVVKFVLSMGFDTRTVAAVLEDRIGTGNEATSNDTYGSASELLDDVTKKEEEMKREAEERSNQASAASASSLFPLGYAQGSSSMLSVVSCSSSTSSLGPSPGSGKYNVSYFGDDDKDDDERMDQELYGSVERTSTSGVTDVKQTSGDENDTESLRQALEQINEEKLCKICFSNQADMVFVPCSHLCCCMECTQAIRHCPVCRKTIERAIKTYVK